MSTSAADDRRPFGPTSGTAPGWVGVGLAVVAMSSALLSDHTIGATRFALGSAIFGLLVWCFMLRPRVVIGSSELELRNPFTSWHVPLASIRKVAVRAVTRVYTDERDTALLEAVRPTVRLRSIYSRQDQLTEAALYGEVAYDLSPRMTVTLGGRVFATRVDMDAGDFGLAQTPLAPTQGRLIDQGVAPKLRVSYAGSRDIVVYAQVQEGYRAGGFNIPSAAGGSANPERVAAQFHPDHLCRIHARERGAAVSAAGDAAYIEPHNVRETAARA